MASKTVFTLSKKVSPVHVSFDMTGKMLLINGISTSPLCNKYCQARVKNPEMICAHCFSIASQWKKGLRENLIENSALLNDHIFTDDEIPILWSPSFMFRFESYGDLQTEIQAANYFKFAEKNPGLHFALWTKNPWIIENMMKTYGIKKPANLRIIGSSYLLNKPMTDYYKKFDFIDNVFTVYSLEYAKEHNIRITCGARSCFHCEKCYIGTHEQYEINELLKADANKARKIGFSIDD